MFNFRRKRNQLSRGTGDIYDKESSAQLKVIPITIASTVGDEKSAEEYKRQPTAQLTTDSILLPTIPSSLTTTMPVSSDDLCSGFEPQTWKKDRCRKCFRFKDQHSSTAAAAAGGSVQRQSSTPIEIKTYEKPKQLESASLSVDSKSSSRPAANRRDTNPKTDDGNQSAVKKSRTSTHNDGMDVSATYILKSSSNVAQEKQQTQEDSNSKKRRTKFVILKAEVSVDGTPAEEVSLETAIATDSPSNSRPPSRSSRPPSRRSLSPPDESYRSATSSAAEYITASSGYDPLSRTVSWESVASTILDDKSFVTGGSGGAMSERSCTPTESLDETRSFVRSIKTQLEIMENKCAKLEEENIKLRRETSVTPQLGTNSNSSDNDKIKVLKEKLTLSEGLCQDYKGENAVLKRDLTDLQSSVSKQIESEKKGLKATLTAAEQLCEELMDENENLKRDVHGLQQEISEMHDQYREEEIEEFRELQRDLEQTAKNCRVLQFKLRKAERKCDQTEADRLHLEEKIKELLGTSDDFDPTDTPRMRELESELRIAKEVSVRLHNELETVDEKRCKLEDENFYLREKVREIETREKLMEQSLMKQDQQQKKSTASMSRSLNSRDLSSIVGQNGAESTNVQQLLRDLKDTLERETDLKEQLKFAEEDIQAARKKLTDLETENDGLVQQLTKLTSGPSHSKGKPPMRRSYSEGHAQIELELAEHEAHVLKSKLDRLEKENEHLLSQNSLLEKEVKKVGGKTSFTTDDYQNAFPDTYYKNKIKMLEEEINDWKLKFETIQKTEADQDTARRFGKLSRSHSANSDPRSELDLQRKLELVEQEAGVLRLRISDLEMENERPRLHGFVLCGENKRINVVRKSSIKSSASNNTSVNNDINSYANEKDPGKLKEKIELMQKDIHRFINRISELEKEKEALNKEVDRRKKLENIKKESVVGITVSNVSKLNLQTASASELRSRIHELIKENNSLSNNLTAEQKKMVELELQLGDYKQIISQSENEKLITMASKVEVLTNQLKEAQNRIDTTQKKMSAQTGRKYEEVMKEQIEILEKSLEEERNKAKNQQQTISLETSDESALTELTKSNQLLKYVEEQVDRLCKQIEKIESQSSPKPSPRLSRSPKIQTLSATVANGESDSKSSKDIEEIKKQLEGLKLKLSERKKDAKLLPRNGKISTTTTTKTETLSSEQLMGKCQQQEKVISDLKDQLEVSKQERVSAYYECETATARLLQTEERWNKELEKVKESYENQVKDLKYYLKEAEKMRDEKTMLLHEREAVLQDKTKRSTEFETKVQKLENELKTKHKDLQDKFESEKKKAKEFETKYQKLETLYESDRQKLSSEKEKFKQDLLDMKKKYDETQTDFEKLKSSYERKEQIWHKEKVDLENRIKSLQDEIKQVETKVAKRAAETASVENKKLLSELSQLKKKMESDYEDWKVERTNLQSTVEQKTKDLEFRLDELERMKKETNLLKSRVLDQKQQLEDTRRMRDEAREELSRWQQTWNREKADIGHKKRQEDKVQHAEQQALQLKYESRMKIMEDSSKRVQIELTQVRRERDQIREALAIADKRLAEMRQKFESGERGLRQDLSELEKKKEAVDSLKSQLDKELIERKVLQKNYDIDKRLWSVEREQFMNKIQDLENGTATMYSIRARANAGKSPAPTRKEDSDKLLAEAMEVGNEMRQQIDEMKKSHDQESNTLRQQLEKSRQDSHKEKIELQRKIKDLQENLKLLDVERRNMLNAKGENLEEKTYLQLERESLMDKIHDAEVHQLANKYKLDKVAEQLTDLQNKMQKSDTGSGQKVEFGELMKKAMDQLLAVREDMGKTRELGKNLDSMDYDDSSSVSSKRSVSSKKIADLESIERETGESLLGKEKFDALKGRSPRLARKDQLTVGKTDSQTSYNISRSISTDTAFEARIAELRLRSASPVPRKVTNYPEAPPNMIINVKNAVQYDSDGRRHWTRRSQIKRSTSFDPSPVSVASSDVSDNEESKSTRSHIRDPSSDTEDYRRSGMNASIDTDTDLSSTGSQSPRSRRKIIDIFATFRKHKSKDRRKLFGHKKANSIETSDVGHTIGAIAVQIFPPAVDPSTLPESMQTPAKVDEPPKLAKSGSGSSLFAKFRRSRSSSRGGLPRQSASVDTGSDLHSGQSTPSGGVSVFGSKTTSQDNVLPKKDEYSSSSQQYSSPQIASRNVTTTTTPTSSFRRLTSSYRSLSSKYMHRF